MPKVQPKASKMSKHKCIISNADELYARKIIKVEKKDPVWVYLENEMREAEKAGIKPYNEKVGKWLAFLKDMKQHFKEEAKNRRKLVYKDANPEWFLQYSEEQIKTLTQIGVAIHGDLLQGRTYRIRAVLSRLGLRLKFTDSSLLKSMKESSEDPGLFMWQLFTHYYNQSPAIPLPRYDSDARIFMSAFVFIDLEECYKELHNLTSKPRPKVVLSKTQKKKTQRASTQTKNQYSTYLSKVNVPCYMPPEVKRRKHPPFHYRVKLRTPESLENLRVRSVKDSLQARQQYFVSKQPKPRICKYNFWKPPVNPLSVSAYAVAKVYTLAPSNKFKDVFPPHCDFLQANIGAIVIVNEMPYYLFNSVVSMSSSYLMHHGGNVLLHNEYCTHILGYIKRCDEKPSGCGNKCDCVNKWNSSVVDYMEKTKCKCNDRYDKYKNTGKATEKYFTPASKYMPHDFDKAKIYSMDPWEGFVKKWVDHAVKSVSSKDSHKDSTVPANCVPIKQLVATLLHDIMTSRLLLPHLPDADMLYSLQAWTRKRVRGDFSHKQTLCLITKARKRWNILNNDFDFRARAYSIPFTKTEKEHLNYNHRHTVQILNERLFKNFQDRNDYKQLLQSRLWWSTMRHDDYPSKNFLDTFYCYLPSKRGDVIYYEPFNPHLRKYYGTGKTCHIEVIRTIT